MILGGLLIAPPSAQASSASDPADEVITVTDEEADLLTNEEVVDTSRRSGSIWLDPSYWSSAKAQFLRGYNPVSGWTGGGWFGNDFDKGGSGLPVYYVRTSGNDTNNGKSRNQAFATINKAIATVPANSIIVVGAGVYTNASTMTVEARTTGNVVRSFILYADTNGYWTGDAGQVTIRSLVGKNDWMWRFNQGAGYIISGFTFEEDPACKTTDWPTSQLPWDQYISRGYQDMLGLIFDRAGQVLVHNCKFSGFRHTFYMVDTMDIEIRDCTFENTRYMSVYGSRAGKTRIFRSTFRDPAPKPTFNAMYQIYGDAARYYIERCSFDATNSFSTHNDNTASNTRMYQHGIVANGFGYNKDITEANLATLYTKNCTFKNFNHLSHYGVWLRHYRCKSNTFDNTRYGSHGHAEVAYTVDSTFTLADNHPWIRQWTWGVYQNSFVAPVRKDYESSYAAYKKSNIGSKIVFSNVATTRYYVGIYIGSDNATLNKISVTGRPIFDNTDPKYENCHGIYNPSVGQTFTLSKDNQISLTNCYWGIVGGGPNLVLNNLDISNQMHGVNWNTGGVSIQSCNISNNRGHGVYVSNVDSLDARDSTFTGNSQYYSGCWNLFAYSKKTPRSDTTNMTSQDAWNETYLYGTYTGRASILRCNITNSGKWKNDTTPPGVDVWGHGVGLYYFADFSMSGNYVTGNCGHGVLFGDGNFAVDSSSMADLSGNYYGLWATGYRQGKTMSGNYVIDSVTSNNNVYGILATNTKATISRCTSTNNREVGIYSDWANTTIRDSKATGSNTGLGCFNNLKLDVNGITSTGNKGWGGHVTAYQWYEQGDVDFGATISVTNSTFNNNSYGGLAMGGNRYYKSGDTWKGEYAKGFRHTVKNVTCNENQYFGLHTYGCWIASGTNLGIQANNNGTYRYDSDGNQLLNWAGMPDRNSGYGVYIYRFGDTVRLSDSMGITAEGNASRGWLNYYDSIVLDTMTFGPNGYFGYNPKKDNGVIWGDGYGFHGVWNPSITINNVTGKGSGLAFEHFKGIDINKFNSAGGWCGLYLNWGAKGEDGEIWKPSALNLSGCTFNDGIYGYYQYAYEGGEAPQAINNVTTTGNRLYGIVTHRTTNTISNINASNNGYAGLYCWSGDVTMTDSQVTNNCWFTYENGARAGYFGALMYCWERPYTYVVRNSAFDNNEGYGLYVGNDEAGATSTINKCTFNNNRYSGYLGNWVPTTVADVTANGNGVVADTGHHGLFVPCAPITATNCTTNGNDGWGIVAYGRYQYFERTRSDGTTYGTYSATGTGSHQISNCTVNANLSGGVYAIYGGSNISNCQVTNNGYYGMHVGYDDEDQTATATVSNCTISGSTSIGLYGYDIRVLANNLTLSGNGHGYYHYSPAEEPDAGTIQNCSMTNNNNWGIVTYYEAMAITNTQVTNNGTKGGGGILTQNSTSDVITDCAVRGNNDIGIYCYRSNRSQVERCYSQNNRSYGMYVWENKSSIAKNCVITGNGYGVLMDDAGTGAEMWNCTIANSTVQFGFRPYRGSVKLYNTVVANNREYGIYNDNLGSFTHQYNLVYGHRTGTDFYRPGYSESQLVDTTEVRKPPRFVDPVAGNFQLAKGSPAINAGRDAVGIVDSDLLGNARPLFKRTEIGAYEYTDPSGSLRITQWNEVR